MKRQAKQLVEIEDFTWKFGQIVPINPDHDLNKIAENIQNSGTQENNSVIPNTQITINQENLENKVSNDITESINEKDI